MAGRAHGLGSCANMLCAGCRLDECMQRTRVVQAYRNKLPYPSSDVFVTVTILQVFAPVSVSMSAVSLVVVGLCLDSDSDKTSPISVLSLGVCPTHVEFSEGTGNAAYPAWNIV